METGERNNNIVWVLLPVLNFILTLLTIISSFFLFLLMRRFMVFHPNFRVIIGNVLSCIVINNILQSSQPFLTFIQNFILKIIFCYFWCHFNFKLSISKL